ncbi:MAG TPA: Mor transcription activator family protein [bacterium]|nr:Mor transcription activator family protein [bacterium]
MSTHRRAKAEDLLPPELVEQIQEHFAGGFLYVRSRGKARRAMRNLEIIRMFNEGKTITEIAETFLLSRTGIRYILKNAGRK